MKNYHLYAIGNALVDSEFEVTDALLEQAGVAKRHMTLIDAPRRAELLALAGNRHGKQTGGGSAGNTVAGVASLGGSAAYIGKVAADKLGEIFRHDITAQGVHFQPHALPAGGPGTGRCLINVTPDGQRTMSTYLGAANLLTPADVEAEVVRASTIVYLEGYLFDPDEARLAFVKAARIARDAGRKIALTLSDAFVVERHRTSRSIGGQNS